MSLVCCVKQAIYLGPHLLLANMTARVPPYPPQRAEERLDRLRRLPG
jgi:hypothetical protein